MLEGGALYRVQSSPGDSEAPLGKAAVSTSDRYKSRVLRVYLCVFPERRVSGLNCMSKGSRDPYTLK